MIKFEASDAWYRKAASQEEKVDSVMCGSEYLDSDDEFRPESLLHDVRKLRRGEGFATLLRMLRLERRYSYKVLAEKIQVKEEELILLEKQVGFVAHPRTLSKLASFYKIDSGKFLQMSGAFREIDARLDDEVVKFAAESESFDKLTKEEKRLLNRLIKFISKN